MSTLTQALATALELSGEPQLPTVEPSLLTEPTNVITSEIVGATDGLTDFEKIRLRIALENAAQQIQEELDAETKAENVQRLIPQVDAIVSQVNSWTIDQETEIGVKDNTGSPIYELQVVINSFKQEGLLGDETATDLLNYLTSTEQFDWLSNHPSLEHALSKLAPEAYETYTLQAEHAAEIAALSNQNGITTQAYNDLIASEFERCTGEIIDLSSTDPFADILQEFQAFDQIVDEETEAYDLVAEAINGACGHYLDLVQDEEVKAELVSSLASRLEQPLKDAVQDGIKTANTTHTAKSFISGMNFSNWLNRMFP
ncbi:MAG: hypothetical protein AAF988_04630 [Pseudomonadota bacterium]